MSDDESKSLDVLGIKPIADSALVITKAAMDGAGALLGRICLPAAEEFGLLLKDRVSAWRKKNIVGILEETQAKLDRYAVDIHAHAHPRLIAAVLEGGSWSDDKTVQEMWAGLLASSCVLDGRDDSNLVFTGLLNQLTGLQARILKYSCEKTEVYLTAVGLIMPKHGINVDVYTLKAVTEIDDLNRIDFELDRLRELGLIMQGFSPNGIFANVTATALSLNMFVKCQGYRGSAVEYFKLAPPPASSGSPSAPVPAADRGGSVA